MHGKGLDAELANVVIRQISEKIMRSKEKSDVKNEQELEAGVLGEEAWRKLGQTVVGQGPYWINRDENEDAQQTTGSTSEAS